jgi:DNA-directed RNA polymerase subunit RPC12/RpoP
MSQSQYPCAGCGANVEFAPGTNVLKCPYCGHETALQSSGARVREHDYLNFTSLPRKPIALLAKHVFVCQNCGAQTESDAISDRCRFCGAAVVAEVNPRDQVVPEAVLPFVLGKKELREALGTWASSRWFAPSGLKKVSEAETAKSTYLPHWTYDARTVTDYEGQRGEHYYVTETYTENGESKTRQVQRTHWYHASGTVGRDFDDVLIPGTTKVTQKHLDELEPWTLADAKPYRPEYLAGHETLRYDVEPETGLESAKGKMRPVIEGDCRGDIGGDEQRLDSMHTQYNDVTFKLMLLPVWIACYLYAGKTYNIQVNGVTGEVAGERPYSAGKIALAVIGALLAIAAIVAIVVATRR